MSHSPTSPSPTPPGSPDLRRPQVGEPAPTESDGRYRALFNDAVEGILLLKPDGTVIRVNASFARMHGYDSPEEMESLRLADLDVPEEAPLMAERVRRLAAGEVLTFEVTHLRKDGSRFPLSVTASRVDLDGTWHLQAFHRDITEQRRNERLRDLASEVLRILNDPEAVPDAIQRILEVVRRDTGIEAVGIRLQKDQDFPYAASVGLSAEFVAAENRLAMRARDGEFCLDELGNVRLECTCGLVIAGRTDPANPLFTPGGSAWTNDTHPFLELPADQDPRLRPRNRCIHAGFQSVALVPIRVDGKIIGLLQLNDRRKGCFTAEMIRCFEGLASSFAVALQRLKEDQEVRDSRRLLVEAQKLAGVESRRQEARLRLALEAAGMVTWELDIHSGRLTYSSNLATMANAEDVSPYLTLDSFVAQLHPEDRAATRAAITRTLESGCAFDCEYRVLLPDGSWHWLAGRGSAVAGVDGRPVSVLGVSQDITARKQAEDELIRMHKQRERLLLFNEALLAAIPTPVFYKDRDGRYLGCNRRFTDLMGVTPEAIKGKTDEELWPSEQARECHQKDLELVANPGEQSYEFQVRDKAGVNRPVIFAKSVFFDEENQPAGIIGAFLDISERKRAEQELAAEATRRRMLIEGSRDGIVVLDEEGRVLEANRRFAELLGYTAEEVLRLHVWDWDRDWQPERVVEAIRELGPEGAKIETRHWRKDGSTFDVELSNSPVQLDGRKLVFCVCHDVTERKRVEALLRESLLFRREAEKIARIGAWKVSPATDYLYWTEGVYEIIDAPLEYRPGLREGLTFYDAESIPRLQAALQAALQDGTPFLVEAGLTTRTGRHCWTEVRGLGRLEEDGQAFVMGTFQDITERKRLESQLREAQKLEAVGQLAGGIAHDFNNILAAMMMHLGLMQTVPDLDAETRQSLQELEKETRRAASLTRQLLMFSRRSVLAIKPQDMNEIIGNLLKMLTRLIGENIQLRLDGTSGLPAVEADAGMIEQVILNLVVNARDAMPKGGRITLSTSLARFDDASTTAHPNRRSGQFVCLSVSDAGIGMSEATLKRIFEPFFTTKEPGRGTGLGLATVHGIVAQHHGWVEVESVLDAGSTFRVYLPAMSHSTLPVQESSPPVPLPRGKETILIVEDEGQVRELLGRTLRTLGYAVHEAANGQAAMSLWQQCGPQVDLLLTDMVMPEGMTGLELTQKLRTLKPGLKVIISSGYSSEIVHAGLPAGSGLRYLPKPYSDKVLAEAVRQALDARL